LFYSLRVFYFILACLSDRHIGCDGGVINLSIFGVLDDKFFHVIVIELLEFKVHSMEVHPVILRIALALLVDGLELLLESILDSFLNKSCKFFFGLVGLVLRLLIPSLVLTLTLGFVSVTASVTFALFSLGFECATLIRRVSVVVAVKQTMLLSRSVVVFLRRLFAVAFLGFTSGLSNLLLALPSKSSDISMFSINCTISCVVLAMGSKS